MKKQIMALIISPLITILIFAAPGIGFAKDKDNDKGKNEDRKSTPKARQITVQSVQKISDDRDDEDEEDDRDDDDSDDNDSDDNDSDDNDSDDNDSDDNDSRKGAKDDRKDDEKGNRKEDKKVSGCLKALGHLIAPGWIKRNGLVNIGLECRLPFGIAKKFRGNNASTTPDITAPVLSAITFKVAKNQAEVRWITDEKSDSAVFWSTTTPVNISDTSSNSVKRTGLVRDHQIILKRLNAGTTYHIVVRSRDASGNSSVSGTLSFTTKTPSPDNSLPVISGIVTLSGTTTIQVVWATNEQTTGRVYYSPTLPVVINGTSTAFVNSATTSKNHLVSIQGLTPTTTYYMIVESTDTTGNVSTSATFTARTTGSTPPPADTTPPVISTVAALAGASTTTLTWVTNELSDSKVFYSTTTPIDLASSSTPTVTNSLFVTNHTVPISGLSTSTLYHFVVASTDAAGNTSTSSPVSATTTAGI